MSDATKIPTDMEVAAMLRGFQEKHDPELTHIKADALLCDLLRALGYNQTVFDFENLEKWYA